MIFIYFYNTIKSEEILLFQDFSPLFQDFLKLPSFKFPLISLPFTVIYFYFPFQFLLMKYLNYYIYKI